MSEEDGTEDGDSPGPEIRPETGLETQRNGRFRTGESGNPGGRPKGRNAFRAAAREMSPVVLAKLFTTAMAGTQPAHVKAGEIILSYAWGKPTMPFEVSGPKGKPVEITDPNRPSDEELDRKMATLFEAAKKVTEHASQAAPPAASEAEEAT